MKYDVLLSSAASKDVAKLRGAGLLKKAKLLLDLIAENPFENPPPYEKLVGNLAGFYSRRINRQHRLVYQVLENHKIQVLRMWTHYE